MKRQITTGIMFDDLEAELRNAKQLKIINHYIKFTK